MDTPTINRMGGGFGQLDTEDDGKRLEPEPETQDQAKKPKPAKEDK